MHKLDQLYIVLTIKRSFNDHPQINQPDRQILCGVFLVESLSVIIQRYYFKYTKKKTGTGVRVFRMSPLHHHFQKENPDALIQHPNQIHPENKIVVRFWIVSILLAVLTIVTLKIR